MRHRSEVGRVRGVQVRSDVVVVAVDIKILAYSVY